MKKHWLATFLGLSILAIIAVLSAEAAVHPQIAQPPGITSDQVSVNVKLPGPGHPAEITVSASLTSAGQLVIDAAQTGSGGYTRTELYDSGSQKQLHEVRVWNDGSSAVRNDDVTVYVSTNGGTGFTTYSFSNIQEQVGAPSGLAVVAGDCSATLTWNAVDGADGYRIFRRAGSSGRLVQVTSTLVDTTNYSIAKTVTPAVSDLDGLHDGCVFWDPKKKAWRWIGIFRGFGLNWEQGSADRFVNLTSRDLNTWTVHENIMNTDLAGPDYKIDDTWIYNVWACHCITRSGYHWLFFTGVDRMTRSVGGWDPASPMDNLASGGRSPQRIFLVKAPVTADLDDPTVWEEVGLMLDGAAPNVADDPGWTSPTLWDIDYELGWRVSCRDPFIYFSEQDGTWVMYVTAVANWGAEAICAATSPSLQGPWTWKGAINATNDGRKNESPALLPNADGTVMLIKNGGSSSDSFIASGPLGNFSSQALVDIGDAIWEPMPFVVMGSDTLRARPWKHVAQSQFSVAPSEGSNLYTASIYNHIGINDGNKVTGQQQFLKFRPMDTINGLSFVDKNLSDGITFGYSVAAVKNGGHGGLSAIEEITGKSDLQVSDYVWNPSTSTMNLVMWSDLDMAAWEYRYRYDESQDTDSEAAVAGETWSSYKQVSANAISDSEVITWVPSQAAYAHIQVQARAQSTTADYDHEFYAYTRWEPPAPQPQNANGAQNGADIDLTWNAVSHPAFLRYVVVQSYNDGGGYVTTEHTTTNTSWTLSSAPGGDYVYVIHSECTVYGETERSAGSTPPIILFGVN